MKSFLLPLLLAAASCLCFSGCDPSSGSSGNESPASLRRWKIGVSIPASLEGWSGGVVWQAYRTEEEMEKTNPNVNFLISTSSDAQDQAARIENLMVRGIDALVVMAQDPEALLPVCEQAKKKGVYLVVVSAPLPKNIQDVSVNGDNAGFGAAAADAMGRALEGKGSIAVMEGDPSPAGTERMDSFRRTLAAKYPGIRILDSRSASGSFKKAQTLMEEFLQKYPGLDGVWACDDEALLGALQTCETRPAGQPAKIKALIGGGGSHKIIRKVMDSDPLVKAVVTWPPQVIREGMKAALDGLNNGKLPPGGRSRIKVPSRIVFPDNAKEFYFPDSVY